MPSEVWAEVVSGRDYPGEAAIDAARSTGWLSVCTPSPPGPELPDLDEGEAACIRIALAQAGPALLLMDERAGRTVAEEHGPRVAGTAAVIGLAKTRGLVPSAREVFARFTYPTVVKLPLSSP